MEVIIANDDKNVKWKYELKNKLIIFIHYLFLILSINLYNKINLKFNLNYQIDIFILINYN